MDKKPGACGASIAHPAVRTATSSRIAQRRELIPGGACSRPARSRSAHRSGACFLRREKTSKIDRRRRVFRKKNHRRALDAQGAQRSRGIDPPHAR